MFTEIAISGLIVTEAILIYSVMKLTKQMRNLSGNLEKSISVVEEKLHAIVEKVNFDIPKIMEQGLNYIKLFKGKNENP